IRSRRARGSPSANDPHEGRRPMSPHVFLSPKDWKPALGYSNGVAASGRMLYLGGMIGWYGQQGFESDDFIEQAAQSLRNIVEVLDEGGAGPEHLVRLTWYVTDSDEYV